MEDWGVSLPLPMPAEVPHTQPICNTSGAATVKPLSTPLYCCSCICLAGLGLGILTNRALSLLLSGNWQLSSQVQSISCKKFDNFARKTMQHLLQLAIWSVPCCRGELITKSNRSSSLLWTDCFEREERYWMDG